MEYTVIRSDRRTVSIGIEGSKVIVRAPRQMTDRQIRQLVESKADWIEKHLPRQSDLPRMSTEDIRRLADRALEDIPARVKRFAPLVGVTYGNITIRNQRSRWGSCSSKGNLNFNCLLMLTPPEIRDYVVVHELCHRLELNHSARFWAQVERVMPDYRKHLQWLKEHGGAIIGAMIQ